MAQCQTTVTFYFLWFPSILTKFNNYQMTHMRNYLRITSGREALIWWVGVVCARGMGKYLIICLYIVLWPESSGIWCLPFFGAHWVMPQGVIDLIACWQGHFRWHKNGDIWKAIPRCLVWCLWQEGNARNFKGCERTAFDQKLQVLRSLFEWMTASESFSFSNLLYFIDICNLGS